MCTGRFDVVKGGKVLRVKPRLTKSAPRAFHGALSFSPDMHGARGIANEVSGDQVSCVEPQVGREAKHVSSPTPFTAAA